jgi:hypothetical protein
MASLRRTHKYHQLLDPLRNEDELSCTGQTLSVPDSSSSDEAEVIWTTSFSPLHTTHQLAKRHHSSLLSPSCLSTHRCDHPAVPEAPNISRGFPASPCLLLNQRQLVSSAETPCLLPNMHPETPHDVSCPLETPATHMAPLETWEVVEEV